MGLLKLIFHRAFTIEGRQTDSVMATLKMVRWPNPNNPTVAAMNKHALIEGAALTAAVAAAAGAAVGLIEASRGPTPGAPGMAHGLARIGRLVGGGMTAGLAATAGGAALLSLALYHTIKLLDN